MDIVIWFEKEEDGGDVIAVALTAKGRETLTHLMFSQEPIYALSIDSSPDEFVENIGGDARIVLYDEGHYINLHTDKKVLQ